MSTALRTYYRGHSLVGMRDEVAAQTRTYHFDHQGTTQALTDSNGTVTDRFACDAWGVQVKRTGSSINRHWYVGQLGYYRQVDQMLDYVRARYLASSLARWKSVDSAPDLSGDVNRYRFHGEPPSAPADAGAVDQSDAARRPRAPARRFTLPGPRPPRPA